jgi:L-asparaginase/Glu-tRNA(Gln) amidotransferase subunit D
MAYTASALAFMLGGLGKPVVLTGSQRPLVEAGSDGRDNFVSAVRTAAFGVPRDVCIAFGGRLLRGCRATKVSATRDAAFDSPNYAPLAAWLPGEDITAQLRSTPVLMSGAAALIEVKEPLVVATRFFPGLSATVLGDLVKPREPALRGLVLEMFGTGNGPTHQEFIDVLVAAHRAKVAVVAVSQCLHGEIDWVYEAGTPYRDAHVISGRDMTTEAAVAKLTVLASQDDYEELRKKMATNLRGEMKDS